MLRAAWALGVAGLTLLACVASDPRVHALERGEIALSLGNAEDAADAFRAALAYRPDDPRAIHGLARAHLARGADAVALEIFADLQQADARYLATTAQNDFRSALFQAARARLRQDDPGGALRLLRRLEALDPAHPGLAETLSHALIAQGGQLLIAGRREQAEALLAEALQGRPRDADTVSSLARLLIELGRIDTAVSLLSDALLRHPEDAALTALMDRALQIRYPDAIPEGRGRTR